MGEILNADGNFLFEGFPKIARLNRDIIITEKIDGTNAQIIISDDGRIQAASRTRLITPTDDNYGFARWVADNETLLVTGLGPGRHFGEWWGGGIQRGYGMQKGLKHFSLFNVSRWNDANLPAIVNVVPTMYQGLFSKTAIDAALDTLRTGGSLAAPGFMKAEGIVIYHTALGQSFKVTLEKDEQPKGRSDG